MQISRYIAIYDIAENEFLKKQYLINYLNIGKTTEYRLQDLPITNPSCLKNCIVYLEEELDYIRKYHPDATILPYIGRIDKLNKIYFNDLDVLN